ncbi:rhamnogalacturonan lyase family protein [Paenibacillus endoradicis]|uniref:rhamnogalacturonan lyase family protein n=1 Tax=Paenibacillus endoradicis TaxID=2972487 RepID=UPI00280B5B10|nr:S-layer homology domain-containing protein [Paenibacillus endoradicis]
MNRKISIFMLFVMLLSIVSMSLGPITLAGNSEGAGELTPIISEDFEDLPLNDAWGTKLGTAGGGGALAAAVKSIDGNQVLEISGGGAGVRSTQKVFTPIISPEVVLNFDWNVGNPSVNAVAQLSIEDSMGKRYLTLEYKSGTEMKYITGGVASNETTTGQNVGIGFNVNNASYNVEAAINFGAKTIDLTITNLNNSSQTTIVSDIPFSSDTIYNNTVGKIQFNLIRPPSASTSWTTWIDNFNVYYLEALPVAPDGLKTTRITSKDVALAWNTVENAAGYRVYRAAAGSVDMTMIGEPVSNEYVDTTVVEESGYSYYVTAVGANGLESAPSETVTINEIPALSAPSVPTNVRITEVKASAIGLSWTVTEGADGYEIWHSSNETSGFVKIGESNSASYIDGVRDTSVPNYYQIKAINSKGSSPASVTVESSIYTPPVVLPEGDVKRFDFGSGALAEQYLQVDGSTAYSAELKYGFADPSVVTSTDRGLADPLRSDFVTPINTSFIVDLPNGDYTVSLIAGDSGGATEIAIKTEMMQKVQLTTKAAGQYLEMSFQIALVDGQLNLEFSGSAPNINALTITKQQPRQADGLPTVYLAGDSTVQTYDPYWEPQAGWGQMIPKFFNNNIIVKNNSIGGRSSKSFIVEGRLDDVLRVIKPGDYFLIQFGHNDATISVPDRYASPADYKEYLKTYINGTRQRGAEPILVTPMGRRDFNTTTGKFNVSFPEYVDVMKELATELDVQLVDLSALSVAYYDSIGPEGSLSVFLHVEPGVYGAFPNGSADNTHFQEYGAIQLARLLAGGIKNLDSPLAAFVKEIQLPNDVPSAPSSLVAGSISNAGAVLRWNDVQGADIYKIYRKLASESDQEYAMIGTATVPTITIGGMEEGESYHIYVTAINGRGESAASTIITVTTKSAKYRYDFGPIGAPVAAGYTEVTRETIYSAERGYGLTNSEGMIDRDRGAALDDLRRDFVAYFAGSYEFKVDVPNGIYSVKSYTGDFIGSTRTIVNIEGKDYGQVNAGKETIVEKIYNGVAVRDGQINFIFSGQTAHLNGLEITPVMLAPTELKLVDLNVEAEPVVVELAWNGMDDASKYRVYRQSLDQNKAELIGETTAVTYTDTTADIGFDYIYTVSAVDLTGIESVASNSLTISTIDPSVETAAIPTNLTVQSVNKNDATITWDSVNEARMYNVYRSKTADGVFELIGKTKIASYTDTTILTTIPYYYKVASVNAGGISELSTSVEVAAVTTLYRQMETLTRAPVAVKKDDGIYIGWRLLGLDPASIAFNLYRDGVIVNEEPITGSTNYYDALGTDSSVYSLSYIIDGVEVFEEGTFTVWEKTYLSIPMQKPADDYTKDGQPYTYSAGDASVGDLDGDGEYEIVLLWSPSNSKDNSQAGYTGIVYMDAYKLDGTLLWRINLGPNIRAGAHYTQFMVYDLDGDGRAEVTFKTADGTVDGVGNVIGDASADHRNSSGYVLLGNEYLTVFDGLTGAALDTVQYDPPRGDVSAWGDAYGNRVDRFLAAVAYLDGESPSVIFSRGYYTRTVLAAYNFRDGKLSKVWKFDSNDEDYGEYAGQGNHNLSVGDVDGDGKDEISFGAMAIDDDGTPLYNTGLGHGDAMHLSDLDPNRPGLEVFSVHEHTDSPFGMEMRDAATGEILWGVKTGIDTGRGMSADIDPRYAGSESWAATITNEQHIPISGLMSATGEVITSTLPTSTNFGIWWDGDLLRELLDSNRIDKWDYINEKTTNLLTANGALSNNGTKATPAIQADLFGDWREEVIWRSADSSELRLYTTNDVTEYRIFTLMHDPIYRLSVAWQNVSYNQPPHTGYFLGHDMAEPAAPLIKYDSNNPNIIDTTAPIITGLPAGTWTEADTIKLQVEANDPESEIVTLELLFDNESVANGSTIKLTGKAGQHIFTARAVNAVGLEKVETVSIFVTKSVTKPTPNPSPIPQPNQGQMIVDKVEKNDLGEIIINIDQGKNEVLFPADDTVIDKDSLVRLINDDVRLEISGEVIEQLRSLAKEGLRSGSRVSFKFEEVTGVALDALLKGASDAIITSSGKVYKLSLALVDSDGAEHMLTRFDSTLKLSVKIGQQANSDLVGMYYVGENGALEYVGGKVINGYIVADVNHFSHYAALEYDKIYTDVAATFWASDVIKQLSAKHIITGINDTQYAPLRDVSRAEFAALIVRSLQLKSSVQPIFNDVSVSKWYANDIAAAYEAGIITGYDGNRFAPEASITRQEMAVMMLRAYEYASGQKVEISPSDNFTDQDQISTWAKAAVNAIHSIGIIEGNNGNIFNPQGNLNRAESAKVIFELLTALETES